MILTFRPLRTWPGPATKNRKPAPFSAAWSDTLDLLDRELHHLGATSAVLEVAASEREVRRDGQLRADAKVSQPGVILYVETRQRGLLSFPCDTFDSGRYTRGGPGWRRLPGWQVNVRAIALGLEALRKVERYGIANQGQQYRGWNALPSATPMGPAKMTVDEAARLLADAAGLGSDQAAALIVDEAAAQDAYRAAVKQHHPDRGGDPAAFRRLQEAKELLDQERARG